VTVAATPIPTRRSMECGRCGAEWTVPRAERPGAAVHCPYCEAHICGCGCGADLSEMRADAVFSSEAHSKRLKLVASAERAPKKTVADARALQEDAKAHWSMVVDEAILRHFKADPTGTLHADDLESLGIPDAHRNCIGSQFAKWVNRGRMVGCGRRKSEIPTRNAAKSNEYRITQKGRDLIAGPGSESSGEVAPTAGSGEDHGVGPAAPPSSDTVPTSAEVATDAPSPDHLQEQLTVDDVLADIGRAA
jgi:hypothetical protein